MIEKTADIVFSNEVIFLTGKLNFNNVMFIYKKSLAHLGSLKKLEFDFSKLEDSDSSGIALIIEWIKLAKKNNKPIFFHSISPNLMSIAKVAGLEKLI